MGLHFYHNFMTNLALFYLQLRGHVARTPLNNRKNGNKLSAVLLSPYSLTLSGSALFTRSLFNDVSVGKSAIRNK
jgi:hypothetical protein